MALHLLATVMVATCACLSWWQFGRAGPGNASSFGYALQWPGFGVFVLAVWWWLCRDATRRRDAPPAAAPAPSTRQRLPDDVVLPPRRDAPAGAPDEDAELAAYNQMLDRLNARSSHP